MSCCESLETGAGWDACACAESRRRRVCAILRLVWRGARAVSVVEAGKRFLPFARRRRCRHRRCHRTAVSRFIVHTRGERCSEWYFPSHRVDTRYGSRLHLFS